MRLSPQGIINNMNLDEFTQMTAKSESLNDLIYEYVLEYIKTVKSIPDWVECLKELAEQIEDETIKQIQKHEKITTTVEKDR